MMDEIEMIKLDNIINYFDCMVKRINEGLNEAKDLHKAYIANGGEFVEDNYNDMKSYAMDKYDYFTGLAKKEIKCLPAVCKKAAAYKEALANYKAALADLLNAIEAFEIEEEVVEAEESVEAGEMELVEEVVIAASNAANVDDWHEPTAEELKRADQDAALDDAYDAAYEELDDLKVKTVEAIWEYEYGGHKSDEDADEQLSKLKETLGEIKAALNKIENAMYRYNKGWMEYWDADHAIFMAMEEF